MLFACSKLRMDSLMYNSTKLESYLWDDYSGEVDFRLDESYKIDQSMLHELNLTSTIEGTSSSAKIAAIYLGDTSKIATDTVILYCHGNRDHMDFYWQRAKLLAHIGGKHHYGVMMFDYRGYGKSEGESSEAATYADTQAALRWLSEHGLKSERFFMYGFSLGTSVVCEEASAPRVMRPAGIMLEAPFASTEVMVQDGSGLAMPSDWITDIKVDNVGKIGLVTSPLFWIHGIDDSFLSIKTHGEPVYERHRFYKEAHRIAGAEHGGVPQTMGFSNYLEALSQFMQHPH
jgi:pimeloyl-ACP methyl ester carboxylesterase